MPNRKPWETDSYWWDTPEEPDWWADISTGDSVNTLTASPVPVSEPKQRKRKAPTSDDFSKLNRANLGKAYARVLRAKQQQEAKESGMCQMCLKREARPRIKDGLPSARCEECYEKYQRQWLKSHPYKERRVYEVRKSKLKLGLCRQAGCESVAIEGRTLCGYHAEQAADCDANRYKRQRQEKELNPDKCFCCEEHVAPTSRRFCERHLSIYNSAQKRRRDKKQSGTGGVKCA